MNTVQLVYWGGSWTVLGSLTFLIARLLASRLNHAAARHFVWLAAFLSIACLPLCHFLISSGGDPAWCATTGSSSQFTWALLFVWSAGFVGTILRGGVGYLAVSNWWRTSTPYAGEFLPRAFPTNIAVGVAAGRNPAVPITWGFRKPVILLPHSALLWDTPRLNAVLWHELGHARRFDNLTQLFALIVCALHWFNPIFWRSARRLEAEAEIAADDFALRQGIKPSSYATELLAVASELQSSNWKFPAIQTAMVKKPALESRLESIVSPRATREPTGWMTFARIGVVFALTGFTLTMVSAHTVRSFQTASNPSEPTCLLQQNQAL